MLTLDIWWLVFEHKMTGISVRSYAKGNLVLIIKYATLSYTVLTYIYCKKKEYSISLYDRTRSYRFKLTVVSQSSENNSQLVHLRHKHYIVILRKSILLTSQTYFKCCSICMVSKQFGEDYGCPWQIMSSIFILLFAISSQCKPRRINTVNIWHILSSLCIILTKVIYSCRKETISSYCFL